MSDSIFRNWIKQFKLHGEIAFEKRYTFYCTQYKIDVLNYMVEQGTSIRETSAIFNIPGPATLHKWKVTNKTGGIGDLIYEKREKGT